MRATFDRSKGRRWLALAGLAALGVIAVRGVAPERTDAPPPLIAAARGGDAVALHWRAGDRQTYAFDLVSTASIGVAGASAGGIEQAIEGKLHVRVFEAGADEVVLGLQMAPVSYALGGARIARRERDLRRPFVARFARSGELQSCRFGALLEASSAQLAEEIVRSFQCVVPDGAARSWTVEERHAGGLCRAAYLRTDDGIRKRRLACADRNGNDAAGALGAGGTRVVRSSAGFSLAVDASWLERAALDEELITVVGGESMTRAATRGSLVRTEGLALPAELAAAADPDALVRAAQQSAGNETDREAVADRRASAADRERFDAMLAAYDASAGEDVGLLLRLRDALREVADLAAVVPGIARDGKLGDRAMSGLLHALELAGTPAAQKALSEVVGDARLAHMNRIRAVIALGGVDEPSAAALLALRGAAAHRADPDSIDLAHTALLSLGRLGDTLRSIDPERYEREVRGALLEALAAGGSDEAATAALKAIGNARDPGFAPELTPMLGAPSAAVRAAAAHALADVDARGALESLTLRLRSEPDGRVRSSLANGIGEVSETSEAAFSVLTALLPQETNGDARFAIARYLADHLEEYPAARATLREMLAAETEVRIVRYVAGRLFRTGKP